MKGFTAQVNNVSLRATLPDLQNFFSFCGNVDNVELIRDSQRSQVALVTFKHEDALDRAMLLCDSMILDEPVTLTRLGDMHYETTQEDQTIKIVVQQSMPVTQLSRAQDMVTDMLSFGYVLAKDVMIRAKLLDENHQLIPNNISKDFLFNGLPRTQNDKSHPLPLPQISVYNNTHQGATSAGTAIANNNLLQSGSMWITGAFCRIAKAAAEVTCTFKEKMQSSSSPKFRPQCHV